MHKKVTKKKTEIITKINILQLISSDSSSHSLIPLQRAWIDTHCPLSHRRDSEPQSGGLARSTPAIDKKLIKYFV